MEFIAFIFYLMTFLFKLFTTIMSIKTFQLIDTAKFSSKRHCNSQY